MRENSDQISLDPGSGVDELELNGPPSPRGGSKIFRQWAPALRADTRSGTRRTSQKGYYPEKKQELWKEERKKKGSRDTQLRTSTRPVIGGVFWGPMELRCRIRGRR